MAELVVVNKVIFYFQINSCFHLFLYSISCDSQTKNGMLVKYLALFHKYHIWLNKAERTHGKTNFLIQNQLIYSTSHFLIQKRHDMPARRRGLQE